MDSRRVAAAEITKRRNDIRGLKEAGAVTAATQGRATEAKGREMTARRAREGDNISTNAEHDRGASGRMGVAAVATARGIDNRPAWMTEGQGVKRARELEEAGAATAVTQGRVDDELEGIRQAIRGSRPSKVEDKERRDRMAATMTATGMEHEAARPTPLAAADSMDVEQPTGSTEDVEVRPTTKRRRKQKGHSSAAHKVTRRRR